MEFTILRSVLAELATLREFCHSMWLILSLCVRGISSKTPTSEPSSSSLNAGSMFRFFVDFSAISLALCSVRILGISDTRKSSHMFKYSPSFRTLPSSSLGAVKNSSAGCLLAMTSSHFTVPSSKARLRPSAALFLGPGI